jgi:hypothetical protein
MMDCHQVREVMDEYRERSLPGDTRTVVRDHLARCEACREFYAEAEEIGRLVAVLPRVKAPDSFEASLRLRLPGQPERHGRSRLTFPRQALLLAATLLLAIGVTVVYRTIDWSTAPDPATLQSQSIDQEFPVMEIPIEPEIYNPAGEEYIRFISRDHQTGQDVFVQMPASYRIQNFQDMENVYLHEVSH